ncbi:DUF874 domain-containing protein [Sulfitobacter sp. KE34]|uniref:DUF874 domain-containing protein n=1 Tax=unclassified Sulfitobacter TaxID=196795 RepID=UPI0023E11ED2|nr:MULTISPECIES: DUF874 domain-containing protein [unclassified Sulfitobacter]MDF3351832.1 DUF874 domain-containing protein [Sulfitobacter sp. KE12]MDF3355504.1 DUF874 domain-containing protein [Sulfitobacter sp. KE27]MDF3359152.1 DUF874 domain-containing protein [Sulfitobacter sp. KE33]MDF3366576.1 DUF874 domain-containing protein [Sulfitobacter sp. Ks34]MDF3370185.1 DUF874 domain-containing protein [Sulfitobacter sp. Ks43]
MRPIYTFDDFIDMLGRRTGVIITVILLGFIASTFWALSRPQVYQSSATIQIKLPKIDDNLVQSTVGGSSGQRLQLIEQQLLARTNLIDLIKKYDLYADLTALPMTEKVELLRSSVTILWVPAPEGGDRNRPQFSAMTFTAVMEDPADAQAMAHEFAERTQELAAAQRREQTRDAVEFFQLQEENLIRNIAALENERVDFRTAHDLSLEGSRSFRQREIGNLNEAILALDREIIAAQLARDRVNPNARAATVAREQTELAAALESLTTQRNVLQDQRDALRASLQTTPEVDREMTQFERRLDQLQTQLQLITARRNEAEVGFSLEADGASERLITLEAAELPEFPISSSRGQHLVIGGIASVALAIIIAYLMELRRPVLRSAEQMVRETGLMPVVSIPDLSPPKKHPILDKVWRKRSKDHSGRRAR